MKPGKRGRRTSEVEVTNVSRRGFWLLIGSKETFVAFKEFPWFRDASIAAITTVERPSANHLYWPELDIDLAVDSLEHPERYPLVSRTPRVNPRAAGFRPSAVASSVSAKLPAGWGIPEVGERSWAATEVANASAIAAARTGLMGDAGTTCERLI